MVELNTRKNKKKEGKSKHSLFRRLSSSLAQSFSSKRRKNSTTSSTKLRRGGQKNAAASTVNHVPILTSSSVADTGLERAGAAVVMIPSTSPAIDHDDNIDDVQGSEIINPNNLREERSGDHLIVESNSVNSYASISSRRRNVISDDDDDDNDVNHDDEKSESTEIIQTVYHTSSQGYKGYRQYALITESLNVEKGENVDIDEGYFEKEDDLQDGMPTTDCVMLDSQGERRKLSLEKDENDNGSNAFDTMCELSRQESGEFHSCHEISNVSTSYDATVENDESDEVNSTSSKDNCQEGCDRRDITVEDTWWKPGNHVSIIGGKYVGQDGISLGLTASKTSIHVNIIGHGKVCVRMKSVGPFLNGRCSEMQKPSYLVGGTNSDDIACEFSVGDTTKQSQTGRSDKHVMNSTDVHESHGTCLEKEQPDGSFDQNVSLWWEPGNRISIIGGKYVGREGISLGLTASKTSIHVNIDGHGKACIRMKSVGPFLNGKCSEMQKPSYPVGGTNTNNSIECEFSVGDKVWVCGGKYRGRIGTVEKVCPKTLKIFFGDSVGTIKTNYVKSIQSIPDYEKETHDFRMPDYNSGGVKFGENTVTKILLCGDDGTDVPNNSFISHLAGRRLITMQRKANSSKPIQTTISDSSGRYELIMRKTVKSDDGGFYKPKEDRCAYIQVDGPGLSEVSLPETLLSLANFTALPTRKVAARLELLFSPVYKSKVTGEHLLKTCPSSSFKDIREEGHVGCGFICEKLLCDLLGNDAAAERALCIQIRAIIPSKGIYKGMLMRKRITSGPRIQFPSSMKKVHASTSEDISDYGCLVVTQAGVDPSPANVITGKLATTSANREELPDSFCPKELSKTIVLLFKTLKVPDNLIRDYVKVSTRKKGEKRIPLINHLFLRGVADPTGAIPPSTVFLTGMQNTTLLNDFIFITRMPCHNPNDGRLVKVLREKPESMTSEDFEWLNSLSFGVVIFGFPKEGFISTPEQISDGDLDGDRYFCCWNKSILEHIQADIVTDVPSMEEDSKRTHKEAEEESGEDDADKDWFQAAQQFMISPQTAEIPQLIPVLFKLFEEAANGDKENFMRNPNAVAFGFAYRQALDNCKHGTSVMLPKHLWEKVPLKLRKYLIEV